MLILATYDVNLTDEKGAKRLRKVARLCQNYGKRVQNSVFECHLTEVQFMTLKNELEKTIDRTRDSILFYKMGQNWERNVVRIGRENDYEITGNLII